MKTKLTIVILIVIAATSIFFQLQTQKQLRAEVESNAQQITLLKTDNESLSNQLVVASSPKSLSDPQKNELMKLRGEVGALRNQIGQLGKLRAENQQLRAQTSVSQNQPAELTTEEKFHMQQWHTEQALKQMGLAIRIYAGDNNDQYATNFDQLKQIIGTTNFDGNISLDNFEFMNAGQVNETKPDMIIFRERTPRVDANGSWERLYGLADGSVQTVYGGDQGDEKKFAEFETQHSPPPNQ